MSSDGDARDGAKRRGISLGPQANEILQRLYEPQLGPASAVSPKKQHATAGTGAMMGLKSPLKKEPQALGVTALGGGGVLRPKHARMKKNASVVMLSSSSTESSAQHGRLSGTGANLASSASVAVLGETNGVTTMHPTLFNVRVSSDIHWTLWDFIYLVD